MKLFFKTTLWATVVALFFSTPAISQFARCQGKQIVDANGNNLLLRGIGLGGWLVPEAYMLHMPGFGSPKDIHNKVESLLGAADTDEFYRRYTANYVTEQDIRLIASWGFNSIRLPFNYRMLSPENQPGVYLEAGFQVIDSLIVWCQRSHLYVILDLHCAPGGQNSGNISDSDGTARLWTETANQERTIELWSVLAQRYRDNITVIGYDLLNEPVMPSGTTNLDLRNFYMRLCTAVRKVDPNHILFIEGSQWATNFQNLTPPVLFGSNIVYAFHKYWNSTAASSIQYITEIRRLYNVPIWLGEFGENSNQWLHETIALMETNDIGWNVWTHKKVATVTSMLSAPQPANFQRLVDYWNGQASRPSSDLARQVLFDLADGLRLDRCTFHPDLLASCTDLTLAGKAKPYSLLPVPGAIPATDYDLGMNNVAYYDSPKVLHDVQAEPSDYNKRYQYRNDGVDIGKAASGEFYVGWIDTGEWLQYTLQADSTAVYDLSVRIASTTAAGRLKIVLDGQTLATGLVIPNTGGWEKWREVLVAKPRVDKGLHTMRVAAEQGGFNLAQLLFDLATETGVNSESGSARSFLLAQNYPNPFNTSTLLSFTLPKREIVTLSVYDTMGREQAVLLSGELDSGSHQLRWNSADIASGVYFLKLSAGANIIVRKALLVK
jgi:aryl-phospho-beta-D-glucosidase BglC (GH1 family)